jgi:regulator of protease activity HflC (stomatin/prohibitin superfamily)
MVAFVYVLIVIGILWIFIGYGIYRRRLKAFGETSNSIIFSIFAAIILIVILFLTQVLTTVDAGYIGVQKLFGAVMDGYEIEEGLHFKHPLSEVIMVSYKTESYTMTVTEGEGARSGDDRIEAITNDGLTVWIDVTVMFHIDKTRASWIVRNRRYSNLEEFEDRYIRPSIRAAVREAISTFKSDDMYAHMRAEVSNAIIETLREKLKQHGTNVLSVEVRNIGLPQQLKNSIEQKLTAQQDMQRMDYILEKEEKEAERKRIEAEGIKDKQRIINETLSQQYLNWYWMSSLEKMGEGSEKQIYYVPINPSSGMPMYFPMR